MKRIDLSSLGKQATRDAYGLELVASGRDDPRVVVLDADLSGSTKSQGFAKEFPERFFNAGIAEQNMVGMAAGLAASGKLPYASSFAIFVTGRAFEQVRQSIAYPKLPVRLVGSHAGITVGADGSSHQAIEDISVMRTLPNMTVLVPADGVATRALVRETLTIPGPVYLRTGRAPVPTIYGPSGAGAEGGVGQASGAAPEGGNTPAGTGAVEFRAGGSRVLATGTDATIVACGVMVAEALRAAYQAADEGLSLGVIDAYSLKPLDREAILAAARGSGAIVTAEEHSVIGGLGAAVAEVVGAEWPVPVVRIGLQDRFGESGEPDELMRQCGLTCRDILAAARRAAGMKGR